MNRFEGPGSNEAKLKYLDADYQVLRPGSHVVCSVTGKHIALDDLRYWSVKRQEAYVDAETSFTRENQ